MIIDKANILIAYGWDTEMLDWAKEAIDSLRSKQYRVDKIIVDSESFSKSPGNRFVWETVESALNRADLGLVLLTGDERVIPATSDSSAGASSLSARARPNVILEGGYLLGTLGRERVRWLI